MRANVCDPAFTPPGLIGAGDEALWAGIEARFRQFDHPLGCLHLVVGARWHGFHIDNHGVLDIDQIVQRSRRGSRRFSTAAGQ